MARLAGLVSYLTLFNCTSWFILQPKHWSALLPPVLLFRGNSLLKLLHKSGSEVLRHPQRLDRNADSRQPLGLLARRRELGRALLHCYIVWVLREEIRHGSGVLRLQLLHGRLVLVIRHPVAEDLLPLPVGDSGVGVGAAAPVSSDADLLARLGLDGEIDLVEVSEVLARGSREGLHAGELLAGGDALNVVHGDVVEGDEESELVDSHVLEHALGVALEALSQRFGGVL